MKHCSFFRLHRKNERLRHQNVELLGTTSTSARFSALLILVGPDPRHLRAMSCLQLTILTRHPNRSGLRSSANCEILYRPEIVDLDGNAMCAPVGGLPENACAPDDTAAITFATDPLTLQATVPMDGDTNVVLNAACLILLQFNGVLDANSVAALTLSAANAPVVIAPPTVPSLGD